MLQTNPQIVALTPQERALLRALEANRGRVMPRGQLLAQVFGYPADTQTRTLDVHIQHLRHKLAGTGAEIQTVFRVGYRLAG